MTGITGPAREYDDYRRILKGLPMPLAFVDLDLFDANVTEIVRRMGAKRMRIASKSIRCVDLMRRILDSDPRFQGIMCYSGWEAVHLARRGFTDLMVAYPVVQRDQVAAVCGEAREGRAITLMIDCPRHAEILGGIAREEGVVLPVSLDVDMSHEFPGLHFGVWRSPVRTPATALEVVAAVEAQPTLRLDGLMGYEAQLAGVQDGGRGPKAAFIRYLKSRSEPEVVERRARIVEAIEARGHRLRFVNGGGTGSLEATRGEACVTEVTAGSGFYSPTLFDGFMRFRHLPAAGFALEVTRRPAPDIYTCHGGGYVASGSAGSEKLPSPYLPRGAALLPIEGAGEVQTPVVYRGGERLEIGDPILMRHAKAGELCEHFNKLLLIQGGRIAGEALTYRGEGGCFLG